MWKQFIERYGGRVKIDFPLSTLAHISVGYSAGSIKRTCKQVLTKYRLEKLETRPLALQEFVGPLSTFPNSMDDTYEVFVEFTNEITGEKARLKKLKAELDEGAEGDGKKAKKKKGK